MHIFIDESGTFAGIGHKKPSISMLGALIVEDRRLSRLCREYLRIRSKLPQERGEVKGRLLLEEHVDMVVRLLQHHGAIFEVVGIDMGMHTEDAVAQHRSKFADAMTANLTEEHHRSLVEQIWSLRRRLEEFPPQLYTQTQLTFKLVRTVIQHGTLYHCQRNPAELGQFNWVVDAKGTASSPTDWEQWWTQFILPQMQNHSLKNPFSCLTFGDYSYFKRFTTELTDFLKGHIESGPNEKSTAFDLSLILKENFRFSKEVEPGLELVDIVTNATRRALMGNLGKAGWVNIPLLMIGRREPHNISMVSFMPDVPTAHNIPWARTMKHFSRFGRPMLKPDRRRH